MIRLTILFSDISEVNSFYIVIKKFMKLKISCKNKRRCILYKKNNPLLDNDFELIFKEIGSKATEKELQEEKDTIYLSYTSVNNLMKIKVLKTYNPEILIEYLGTNVCLMNILVSKFEERYSIDEKGNLIKRNIPLISKYSNEGYMFYEKMFFKDKNEACKNYLENYGDKLYELHQEIMKIKNDMSYLEELSDKVALLMD